MIERYIPWQVDATIRKGWTVKDTETSQLLNAQPAWRMRDPQALAMGTRRQATTRAAELNAMLD